MASEWVVVEVVGTGVCGVSKGGRGLRDPTKGTPGGWIPVGEEEEAAPTEMRP